MKQKLPLGMLLIMLASGTQLSAQNPGGIIPAAWYRADGTGTLFSDAGVTPAATNTAVQQWNAQSGLFPLLQATSGSRPVYSNTTTLANFNPTLTFDGSNDWMQFTAGAGVNVIDRASGTFYAAGFMNTQKRSGFMGFHASMDYPGMHVYASNYNLLFFTGGPGYQGQSTAPFTAQSFFTAGTAWQNGAGSTAAYAAATVSLNGLHTEYTGAQLNNANLSTGARDLRIGGDNNYGSFSGQLNEILVFEERLTPTQMSQVESYLAIKYGTTYANGTKDYKSSTGTTVWSAAANTGYQNNIAGIARDDQGALLQKQSWSTNAGQQVLIGVGGLANTNAANTGTLTDNQYLVWGDNGLAKVPTVATSAFSGVSHHFPAIWKVQNSGVGTVRIAWPKGFRNLNLIQSADAVIGAGDTQTPMTANEITINGTIYNYTDVTLANGQYFTFAATVPAPGGVTAGLTQWYRADQNLAAAGGSGTNVTSWTDFTRGTVSRQIGTAPVPVYREGSTNYFNFNPGVNFTAIQQMLGNITTQTLESTSFDIFTLTKEGMTGGARFFNIGMNNTAMNGANWDQPGLLYNGNIGTRNNTGGGTGIANPGNINFATNIPSIMYHTFTNTTIRKGLNGAALGTPWTVSARGLSTGGHIFGANGGVNPPGGDDWGFVGHIGEVIIYGAGNISATDRNKVDAYLALKYGITLPAGVNYLSAAGNVVWNAAANSTYHNNVTGIVHDEASALNQKQSKSANPGQQLIIGTTGLANTNAGNGTSLADGQYLIWGDNGLGKVPAVALSGVSGVNFRFAAVWKVQNTASAGTVRVAWPAGLTNLTLIQGTDSSFASVTAAHLMAGNTTTVNGVTYNYADVTLANGSFFTFATQLNGPGGVALNLRVWLRADAGFAPEEWADLSGNANNYTQTNASRQPFLAAKQYNFNPIVDFGGSASADGRFMVVPSGKPFTANGLSGTFFTATMTRNGGTSGYRDIWGFGATTTGSGLGQANEPAVTKLNNDIVLYSSTTSAFPGQYPDNKLLLSDMSYTVAVAGIRYGLNGRMDTTTQTRSAAGSKQADGSILGAQAEVTNGLIGEAIAYERNLTEPEKQRVRTYIAIKYGVTLEHNYTASNGTTVFWDRTINTGYNNNIAGIARDDNGSLNQKQSWSINSPKEVLISTVGLNDDNATNPNMLANQQFLVWGDNGLAKAPAMAFGNIGGLSYNRFPAIWKVQNTASVGTVRVAWAKGYSNLKLIQSSDAVIDLSDVITDMTNTITVAGKEYAYADVTLANGSYFTFAAFVQGPGGVTNNLSLWYRADMDAEATGEGTDVTEWTDFTSGTVLAQLGDNTLPKFKNGDATYFNFNPGVNYTNAAQSLGNTAVQTVTALNFDIYTLTKEGIVAGSNGRVFSTLVDNISTTGSIWHWDGIGLMADNRIERANTARTNRYLATPGNITYSTANSSIMYNTFTDTTVSKGLNGAPNGAAGTHTARGQMTGGHAIGSTQYLSNGSDNAGFTGNIGEVIVFGNGNNTPAERNKVESYLAIKYGLTLHNSNNYTTAQNVVVWNAAANAGFYNNVAGIGNDYLSALHQKQSRSQHANTNSQVTMGLGEIAATNMANPNALSNGQFLVWGDNGNTVAMTNTATTFTAFNYEGGTNNARRMKRTWKVQNTGVSGDMLIRFPVASVGTTTLPVGDACADYAILFADDTAFTTNLSVVPLTVNGTDYEVVHAFANGMSYFTFAKLTPLNNGLVYLPAVTESTTTYDNACNVGAWKYFHKTGDATQKLFAASDYTTTELSNLGVTITPEGIEYNDGTRITKVMPRITTVANTNVGAISNGKVRVYYSVDEMNGTIVPGSQTNGWFKYEGDADSVLTDIYNDGIFNPGKAIALTPAASGIENGVHYVEFHNINSFSSFVYISSTEVTSVVLPVTLLYFAAEAKGSEALLSWGTAKEQMNKGFEIERSADGERWSRIGFVVSRAKNGNSTSRLDYTFTDKAPLEGKNFYRLKQIGLDGKDNYSQVSMVVFDASKGIRLYPNPVSSRLTVDGLYSDCTIKVVNSTGQTLKTLKVPAGTHRQEINMSDLASGIYFIHLVNEQGIIRTFKVMKD